MCYNCPKPNVPEMPRKIPMPEVNNGISKQTEAKALLEAYKVNCFIIAHNNRMSKVEPYPSLEMIEQRILELVGN